MPGLDIEGLAQFSVYSAMSHLILGGSELLAGVQFPDAKYVSTLRHIESLRKETLSR